MNSCGSVSVAEFPINVTEITIEGDEERTEYVAEAVYSLITGTTANLEKRINEDYEAWLEKAKEVEPQKASLDDVIEAVNALAEIVVGE